MTNGQGWRWTLGSGALTILLGVVAVLLPDIEWAPRGGIVGWLLLFAGVSELIFGWKRGRDPAGQAAIGSGLLTALAGLIFIANPVLKYLPLANVVTAWLLLRGAWVLAMAVRVRSSGLRPWLVVSGAADMLLGVALIVGLQIAVLVVTLFGPTREIVAQFSLILAASFLVTGVSHVAMAFVQRRESRTAGEGNLS